MSAMSQTDLWNRMLREVVRGDVASPARADFFQPGVDRVAILREALRKPGNDRVAAITLLQKMKSEEQRQLLPELIELARAAHGPVGAVREVILSLPRKWALTHIVPQVERILQGEVYDDYWMFLELYQLLDPSMAAALARRAATHSDPDIRELGLRHLTRLLLIAAEEGELEERETVRHALGAIWQEPTVQVQERLRGLAEDLSVLAEGAKPQVDMTPAQEAAYTEQAKAAAVALEIGEVDTALASLRAPAPRKMPRHIVPFLQARCWERLGDFETALIFVKEAERYASDVTIFVLALLQASRRKEEARQYADRMLKKPDSSPAEIFFAASALLMPTRGLTNEQARPILERIMPALLQALATYQTLPEQKREVPDLDRHIIEMLGLCYQRSGDEQSARRWYDDALAQNPNDATLRTFRGISQYTENLAGALQDFNVAVDQGTPLVWPYYFLAWHALTRSAYRQALRQASRGARLDVSPSVRAELHEIIAIALSMLGEPLTSVRHHFEQAIALDPTNKRIRHNRLVAEERISAPQVRAPAWEEPPSPDSETTRQMLRSEIEDNQERISDLLRARRTPDFQTV